MKWLRQFGGGSAEGRAKDKSLLGGKGANLAEMASLGLPVPPGFTITTEVCRHVMEHGAGKYPVELEPALVPVAHVGPPGRRAAPPLVLSLPPLQALLRNPVRAPRRI